ncbi:MAG: hypothetical protein JXR31_09565 [Prolixibacteraceae bacterium]|nr:hypothetical protein [Prolixibacteraceae bacterium]
MKKSKGFKDVFKIFQDTELYFDERITKQPGRLILNQVIVICSFAFIYGVIMGSYHSLPQSLVSGFKVIVLFIGAIIVCFPSFFVIQQVLGSKMNFRQMIVIILSGFVLTSAIALSFSPVIIFFQLTGGNYHFIQLLHVAIFLFSGFFGMRLMVDALKFACDKKQIYPQIGVTVFRIWVIILAFVGMQLAWNLRPFVCDKNEEFKLFRKYEGNFYTAVIYSIQQLLNNEDKNEAGRVKQNYYIEPEETVNSDTTSLLHLLEK